MADTFKSKIGLIAATVGSAVGLGNIWRFPAETQSNGGAAFLLVYVICVLVLGIPLMLAEFSLGRGTRSDAVTAFRKLRPGTAWWLTGAMGVLAAYMILCYYSVAAGWILEYLSQSITGGLFESISSNPETSFHMHMEEYISSDWPPIIWTLAVMAINLVILLGGVQKGIERFATWTMPLLFVLLVIFCAVSLSLPGASEGVKFFLAPDFSKLTADVWLSALGQAFFSLSLGMGCLITYGSYYPKSTKLTQTATTVASLDMLVAILTGLVIFPAVASFGLQGSELRGTTLVFVTLPEIFAQMPGKEIWSILFFLLLLIAAVTSSISIAEVAIAFVKDYFRVSRLKAACWVLIPAAGLAVLCSLSFGSLNHVRIFGLTIFDFFDTVSTNWLLPVGALLISIFISWIAPKGFFRKELVPSEGKQKWIYPMVEFVVKWIAPILIMLILLSSII